MPPVELQWKRWSGRLRHRQRGLWMRRLRHQLLKRAAKLDHFQIRLGLLLLLHGHLGGVLLAGQLLLVADLLAAVDLLHVQLSLVLELDESLLSILLGLVFVRLQVMDQLLLFLETVHHLRIVGLGLLLLGDDQMLPLKMLVLVSQIGSLLNNFRFALSLHVLHLLGSLRLELPEVSLVLLGKLGAAVVLSLVGMLFGLLHHAAELLLLVDCRSRRFAVGVLVL